MAVLAFSSPHSAVGSRADGTEVLVALRNLPDCFKQLHPVEAGLQRTLQARHLVGARTRHVIPKFRSQPTFNTGGARKRGGMHMGISG